MADLHLSVLLVEIALLVIHLYRRLYLLLLQQVPINILAELEFFDFLKVLQSLLLIFIKQPLQQFPFLSANSPPVDLLLDNPLVHLVSVPLVMRRQSRQHLIQQHAKLVKVDGLADAFAAEHFGRHVLGRAAEGVAQVLGREVHAREPEVSQPDVALLVHQHVLGLQVAV